VARIPYTVSDRELIELLQIVGYYWTFGRIATVLEVDVDPVTTSAGGGTVPPPP